MENKSNLKVGSKVEEEHLSTYYKLKNYIKQNNKMPSVKDFCEWIASDHLKEDPDYYKKLATIDNGAKQILNNNKKLIDLIS